MGFTVTRPAGTKDAEFQEYIRLLRQQGVDLARAPRVLEPTTGRRWLYLWDNKEDAERFAGTLKKRTGDKGWQTEEVDAPPSEGPLGPVLLQLGRQADGLVFGLHPLSRALIQSAFPRAFGSTSVFVDARRWQDFQKRGGTPEELTWEMALALTGLTREQLQQLGIELIDAETNETPVSVPPCRPYRLGHRKGVTRPTDRTERTAGNCSALQPG
jgi:hypothetical protein